MTKKLLSRALILLIIVLSGISTLIVMDMLGFDLPNRIARQIVHQLPAQEPDSYFVPTPLPIDAPPSDIQTVSDIQTISTTETVSLEIVPEVQTASAPSDVLTEDAAQSKPLSATSNLAVVTPTVTTLADESNLATVAPTQNPSSQQTAQHQDAQISGSQSAVEQPTIAPQATVANTNAAVQVSNPKANPKPSIRPDPIQNDIALGGFKHEWQTWNNCGPATLAMNLSYFGSNLTQTDVAAILRQHEDDKNVSPSEMTSFAQSLGYHAQMRVNGSTEILKTLLSNQIPVLIETWMEPDPNDGMGHYRLLTGYDDGQQNWIAYDSYVSHDFVADGENYQGVFMPYGDADDLWQVFNRTYLLIYDDAQSELVQAIFGDALDPQVMWEQSLQTAQQEVAQEPENPFAWFNLGTSFNAFGSYGEAAAAFDKARQLGLPWRMLWYQFGPFEAYYETGRYEEVLALAYATIANTESIEEIYYWKGKALAATGNPESAKDAWEQALTLNPSYPEAIEALATFQ